MKHSPDIRKRKSIRLKGYDYSKEGLYFITICTHNRECLFGNVENVVGARCTCPDIERNVESKIVLNDFGKIVESEIERTNEIRKNLQVVGYVVMPNHIHLIIEIIGLSQGHVQRAPTVEQYGKSTSNTIPTIVRLIKSAVTKQINVKRGTEGYPVWQRNYYENIIRNEETYIKILEYTKNNHLKWYEDKYYS